MQESFCQNCGSGKYCVGKIWCILDQNNWGGPEQKNKFGGGGELNLRGDLKVFLGERGAMNPSDVMVVVLKDILLC